MSDNVSLRFHSEIKLERGDELAICWHSHGQAGRYPLANMQAGIVDAVEKLSNGGRSQRELTNVVLATDGFLAVAKFQRMIRQMDSASMIERCIMSNAAPFMRLIPHSNYFRYRPIDLDQTQPYVLSRFAFLRREEQPILASPKGYARLLLDHQDAIRLATSLYEPASADDLAAMFPHLRKDIIQDAMRFMISAELLSPVDANGTNEEARSVTMQHWEFHDLLFHARSRIGRSVGAYGGSFRFWGKEPSLPAVKPPLTDTPLLLPKPSLTDIEERDVSLVSAMEDRRSIWQYSEQPMTYVQLSELLFRVARVKDVFRHDEEEVDPTKSLEASRRPYPSGGAKYPLEFYITVRECEGIEPGMYHYDPLHHALHLVSKPSEATDKLLEQASAGPDRPNPAQVLITLAARFQRTQWKYQSVAYAVLLKESGVVYHSTYLVATALGLACCGLGGGDPDLFSKVVGTSYYEESCVGQIALGNPA